MPIIPVLEKVIGFETDLGVEVQARRSYVACELSDNQGKDIQWLAMLDSGAPLSVVPYSIWNGQSIPWQLLGNQLVRNGQADANVLTWFGVACQFGEVSVRLVDQATQFRSGLLRLRAKFPSATVSSHAEKEIVLGQNFIMDNHLTYVTRGGTNRLEGVALMD